MLALVSVSFYFPPIPPQLKNEKLTSLWSACSASPQSLALAWAQLARGRRLPFADALRMEFRLAAHLCSSLSELHEGVRCRLIDRGAPPKWRFRAAEEVPAEAVEAFFGPVPGVDDLQLPSPRL